MSLSLSFGLSSIFFKLEQDPKTSLSMMQRTRKLKKQGRLLTLKIYLYNDQVFDFVLFILM